MKAITYHAYAEKLEQAGATIWRWDPHDDCPGGHFYASRDGRHVRVFFNCDDRFVHAVKVDGQGIPIPGPTGPRADGGRRAVPGDLVMRTVVWLGFAVLAGLIIATWAPHWYFGALAFTGLVIVGAIVKHGSTVSGRIGS